jgi:DNA primase
MQDEIPDTRELMEDITNTFKTKEVILYGPDKLPAGPTLEVSKDIIIVEGRADVLNMLTYGFTNVISTGGARIPKSLPSIVKNKEVTLFLDGDRGADIQQSQLQKAINVDYIARAPDGKEVEELTQKEINQALRRKIKATYLSNSVYSPKPAPGLIKKSKFSTTYEHKVKNQQKPFLKNSIFYPEKQDNSFSNMLSNIPNIERIDSPKQDNYRNNNYKKNNDYKNKVNYKNNDVTNEYFKHKENNINPGYSNDFNKKNTLKEKVENAVKEFGTKLSDKNDNQLSSKNTQKQTNNIQSNNKKDITQQTNILKQESQIKNNNNLQKTKDEIKKPIPPKPKEKPKLTDKMIKNFSKILEDVEGKGKSRFLNEKLRRIGSANDKELLNKLKTFKTNKIFALVTDIEADQEIIKEAKEKQVKFLVSPKSKIKDDSEISILTYNELKK